MIMTIIIIVINVIKVIKAVKFVKEGDGVDGKARREARVIANRHADALQGPARRCAPRAWSQTRSKGSY